MFPNWSRIRAVVLASAVSLSGSALAAEGKYSFEDAQKLLKTYCQGCHQGKSPSGGFNVTRHASMESLLKDPRAWTRMMNRVRDGEMPPPNVPAPDMDQREKFVEWVQATLRTAACADGISPGRAPLRRLNRNEYAATIRDLLNIHINAGHALPADGAGGEGFDNAAETLFLSPIHAEKYLQAAKSALEYAAKDPRARAVFLTAKPGPDLSEEGAARKILADFLPRAFRRPAADEDVARYLDLFLEAKKNGDSFDAAILYALQGVLVSPHFLFRIEPPNQHPEPRLLDDYALASRLSYFLWGTMPDEELFELASQRRLQDPAILDFQITRMLKSAKTREFAEQFVEQWLGTRELGRDIKPDTKLFPAYDDEEIRSAMRYEPILFFQELLTDDLSLLNLLDSKFTILTNKLARHYGYKMQGLRQQPQRMALPEDSRRGGLLGMAAVLAVTSYPHRTSPVLRGKWILEAILGTPPPPPPPNVPQLEESHDGAAPKTLRERLTKHRENPVCASCHSRIDPLGFALENFNVVGQWRDEDAGKPVDTMGQLPDGTTFDGLEGLKKVLLERKTLFIRNLTAKMLGYALGRGLSLEEYCTVDQIVADLEKNNYSAHALIRGIVHSIPFRYQEGTVANRPVTVMTAKQEEIR